MKQKQKWICFDCKKDGEVDFDEHAGAYEVIELVRDNHKKNSPKCNGFSLRILVSVSPDYLLFKQNSNQSK